MQDQELDDGYIVLYQVLDPRFHHKAQEFGNLESAKDFLLHILLGDDSDFHFDFTNSPNVVNVRASDGTLVFGHCIIRKNLL